MEKNQDIHMTAQIATERLNELLPKLLEQEGLTQAEVAARAGIPAQYLSDIKRGQRPVTELLARRLGEEFQFSYRWLLGTSDQLELTGLTSQPTSPPKTSTSNTIGLPLLDHPIEGEPRQSPHWHGYVAETAGLAAGKIGLAKLPYVLKFGRDDVEGRLHQGDWILISQTVNPQAEIRVVRYRKKCFLVRSDGEAGWVRVANGQPLKGKCTEVGHAVGIIWSPLS